jgi:hypothetical protein
LLLAAIIHLNPSIMYANNPYSHPQPQQHTGLTHPPANSAYTSYQQPQQQFHQQQQQPQQQQQQQPNYNQQPLYSPNQPRINPSIANQQHYNPNPPGQHQLPAQHYPTGNAHPSQQSHGPSAASQYQSHVNAAPAAHNTALHAASHVPHSNIVHHAAQSSNSLPSAASQFPAAAANQFTLLKQLDRASRVSWCSSSLYGNYLVSGTVAGTIDNNFETNSALELFDINLSDTSYDMKLLGSVVIKDCFHSVAW